MLRILFALAVVSLLGAGAFTATGIDHDSRPERTIAIATLTGMQR